ncbi:hypothetical protein [Jeotgalibacillus sp. R-1-5s-1]|uniref:hypothetical protein n=1 Tax=Jeotgalibacillus sp. R-1-5s-1 TaxID=2555897 RepID=UPI00106CF9A3|nr:hypothetical protein [Jeotgalibacillus sp. R-1-5s-1]TFD94536.1 hypothetical protein E2491_14000 [Jeotgalibacillus sp. R-1-5s-1]
MKDKWLVLLIIRFQLLLTGCFEDAGSEGKGETIHTTLQQEGYPGVELGVVLEAELVGQLNLQEHPDNQYYVQSRRFDQWWNESVIVSVDRESKEIIQITIIGKDEELKTAKGIHITDSRDAVLEAYGNEPNRSYDREQGIEVLSYVDEQLDRKLVFTIIEDQVAAISHEYAAERLIWYPNKR